MAGLTAGDVFLVPIAAGRHVPNGELTGGFRVYVVHGLVAGAAGNEILCFRSRRRWLNYVNTETRTDWLAYLVGGTLQKRVSVLFDTVMEVVAFQQ